MTFCGIQTVILKEKKVFYCSNINGKTCVSKVALSGKTHYIMTWLPYKNSVSYVPYCMHANKRAFHFEMHCTSYNTIWFNTGKRDLTTKMPNVWMAG